MFSQSEENYLKAIFHLQMVSNSEISTNAIAKKINTKASSVSDMLKKLAEKKLILYKKYRGVVLTDLGKKTASNVVRKHRLWEVFLVNKLNFDWDEVHDIAEQLEHIKSQKLTDKLDAFLNFPKTDPHGDPIPDKQGHVITQNKVKLATVKENNATILLGVKDSSDEFLKYLSKKGIAIGNEIEVINIEPFDKSMHIKINNNELLITVEVANNLLVKAIN